MWQQPSKAFPLKKRFSKKGKMYEQLLLKSQVNHN